MDYRQYRPPAHLAPWVECVWTLNGRVPPDAPSEQRVLPDGCVELILHFGDRVRQDGREQPRRMAAGQMDRCLLLSPRGTLDIVGVRFHPHGARAFFACPLHLLTNRFEELESVIGSAAARQAGEEVDPVARLGTVWRFLERRLSGAKPPDRAVAEGVRLAISSGGAIPVDGVAARAGVGSRQLSRLFQEHVGISPKLFSQTLRFQQVLAAGGRGDWRRLADLAVECGFFDQAHLCHEFRRFSGLNPSTFFSREEVMARIFARSRRRSDSYKTG